MPWVILPYSNCASRGLVKGPLWLVLFLAVIAMVRGNDLRERRHRGL